MRISPKEPIFLQTSIDSGSIGILGSVVHKFDEVGVYRGVVFKDDRQGAVFHLTVEQESLAQQTDIDLASVGVARQLHSPCGCDGHDGTPHFSLSPKGYAVFHTSRGLSGYGVRVVGAREEPRRAAFDSRELKDGDVFACSLVRPGRYSATNAHTEGRAEIVVSYPVRGAMQFVPPEPANIDCTPSGFRPEKTEVAPMQGQVYRIKTPSRIKIEVAHPDDGPAQTGGRSLKASRQRVRRKAVSDR